MELQHQQKVAKYRLGTNFLPQCSGTNTFASVSLCTIILALKCCRAIDTKIICVVNTARA